MLYYCFRIFSEYTDIGGTTQHRQLGCYDHLSNPPWVPRKGEFFRFRDPHPPSGYPNDKAFQGAEFTEFAGEVSEVVTLFYGTRTTIEVYIKQAQAAQAAA